MGQHEPDYRNGYRADEVAGRENAAAAGRHAGAILLLELRELVEQAEGMNADFDDYLEYLIYKEAAQVLLNEGRRIGKIDFGKADKDLEGRKR